MPHETMQRFFEAIREKRACEYRNGDIYEKLLFYHFEEVLAGSFPIFCSRTKERRWRRMVQAFIASDPRDPLIWRAAGEFRKFLLKEWSLKKRERELLWFEWHSLALTRTDAKTEPFKEERLFAKRWRRSKSARIKKLRYRITEEKGASGTWWTLIYTARTGDVSWMELTPFMGELIDRCDGGEPLECIVKPLCRQNGIPLKDVKFALKKGLVPLIEEGVLV